MRSGKENEAESWAPIQNWALRQRTQGKSILFIHHSGKGGQQRGTSRREDVLDIVIALRHAPDYTPEKGASFEVHFEKARGVLGEGVAPFSANLLFTDAEYSWKLQLLDDSNFEKTIHFLNEGFKQSDVAAELCINKSTVSRYARRARNEGRLNLT